MKKLYVIKDEFFAERPRLSVIKNVRKVNVDKPRYYIDPDFGEVFRVEHYHRKPRVTSWGQTYDLVLAQLETHGASRSMRGHRVVHINNHVYTLAMIIASTFIPNPHHYKDILHINGIKEDDRIENLRWVSHSELVRSGYVNNKITSSKAEAKPLKLRFAKTSKEDDDDIIWSKAYTKDEIAKMALDSDYDN